MATLLAGCGSDHSPAHDPSTSITQVAPTAAPTGVQWTSFQGMKIPTADQGPHVSTPTAAPHGFDHNGPGAGLAAINATVRMSVAADDQWATVGDQLLAAGPARDNWTVTRVRLSITAPITSDAPKICGYQMSDYTPQQARVSIISRQADNSLTANAATVVWTAAGDWQLQLPDSGSTTPPVTAIGSLPASMIPLKGQC